MTSKLVWKVKGEKRDAIIDKALKENSVIQHPDNWGDVVDDVTLLAVLGERRKGYRWGVNSNQPYYDQRDRVNDVDEKYHDDVSLVILKRVEKALRARIAKRKK